jgi:hypothetical protein
MDRLNTRNLLKRKKHKLEGNNYNCILYDHNVEETAFHLFFSCPFSQACWQHLNMHWNFQSDFFQMMMQSKQQYKNPFFMEIFIIAAWHIWKQRNNFIFDRGRPSSPLGNAMRLDFKLLECLKTGAMFSSFV